MQKNPEWAPGVPTGPNKLHPQSEKSVLAKPSLWRVTG